MSYKSQTRSSSIFVDVHAVAFLLLTLSAKLKPVWVFLRVCMCVYYGTTDTFFEKSAAMEILRFAPQTDTTWLAVVQPGEPGRRLALTAYPSTPVQGWMPSSP